jgi:type II secretory pathway component GspD/PulD (secretin)
MGGVPFISGIPLIRYLFREWREAERRESLIILTKAEIVPDIFEE